MGIILIKYGELTTKGDNRKLFINTLEKNILEKTKKYEVKIKKEHARMYIEYLEKYEDKIIDVLKNTFGIHAFSIVYKVYTNKEDILKEIVNKLKDINFKTFKVVAKRRDKSFPISSMDFNRVVATEIFKNFEEIKVDVHNPDIFINIEINKDDTYFYFDEIKGLGGYPVGALGKGLLMLSGGIDSPVACKLIMNRGCHVDYLTFHSYPYTPMESLEKVRRLAAILNRHQKPGTLYACNFSEIQKKIRDVCNPKFRTVLYRRYMMRLANMICRRKRLYAIVTGESVGQVASQTVINLGTIGNAAEYVVLRPLCGLDKMETIRRAEELGTFQTSIEDFPDSCTVFAPPSPSVAARLYRIEAEEALLGDMTELLERAYETLEISVDR